MVTKVELEKQVAELKRQLEEKSDPKRPRAQTVGDKLKDAVEDIPEKLSSEMEDWSKEIDTLLAELDSLPHRNAILFTLGVFAAGFMIGRSR